MKIHVKYKQSLIRDRKAPFDWSAKYNFVVEAVSLKRPLVEYETINISGPVKNGDTVWVMHIVKSEGDSCGSSTGMGEVVWVFKNRESAKSAAAGINSNKTAPSFVFADDDGEVIRLSNPATCEYFDHITDVVLTPIVVSEHIEYHYEGKVA